MEFLIFLLLQSDVARTAVSPLDIAFAVFVGNSVFRLANSVCTRWAVLQPAATFDKGA